MKGRGKLEVREGGVYHMTMKLDKPHICEEYEGEGENLK